MWMFIFLMILNKDLSVLEKEIKNKQPTDGNNGNSLPWK